MAVSRTQAWTSAASADPSGTTTIGGGTNRVLIFTLMGEFSGNITASVGIGGVAATSFGKYYYNLGSADDLYVWNWYWDESDLESMSGNTISYSDNGTFVKKFWSYATFASADQTTPVVFSSAASEVVTSADPLVIPTPGESGDYAVIPVSYRTNDLTVRLDPNKTKIFEAKTTDQGGFRAVLMDGAWTSATSFAGLTGFGAEVISLSGVVKQFGSQSGGSGSLVAPSAQADGSGATGINNLINPQPQVSGVAERVVVWTGSVDLVAPKATSSVNATFDLIFNDPTPSALEAIAGEFYALGARVVTGIGSAETVIPTMGGTGPLVITGTGGVTSTRPLVAGNDFFTATWYTRKSCYFLGA